MSIFSKEQIWASNGNAKSLSLFSETCSPKDTPILSLNGGRKTLPCLRDYYVPLVAQDPSETLFAETVFGDLRFWLKIRDLDWMQKYLDEWRLMADTKRKQKAFEAVIREVEEGGRSSFTAAKYLIEEPWKDKRNTKTKEDSQKSSTQARSVYSEDIERLKEEGFLQ